MGSPRVIPAEAGIQFFIHQAWTPAFAGVTNESRVEFSYRVYDPAFTRATVGK